MVLHLRIRMEHVRYRRNVPGVPPRVEIDPVPFVRLVVAPFGLVRAMIKFRVVPVCPRTNPQGTGHFGTVSELRPILTLHDRHRLRWIRSAAIRPKKDNEDEDMAVIANTGKQADLESGLEKTTVQKPPHISPRDFTHWLAAKSRIDDASLQSLFKR